MKFVLLGTNKSGGNLCVSSGSRGLARNFFLPVQVTKSKNFRARGLTKIEVIRAARGINLKIVQENEIKQTKLQVTTKWLYIHKFICVGLYSHNTQTLKSKKKYIYQKYTTVLATSINILGTKAGSHKNGGCIF